ncbi:MAG: hypothetical protein JNJ54_32445 [Myxococcaceae bacterium]|nr:hypothetical protein [Myxococcaceae bacterium]
MVAELLSMVLLVADGGAPQPFAGGLEEGVVYVIETSRDALPSQLAPPALKLPMHHASRVEWEAPLSLPEGRLELTFQVVEVTVRRISERRWNSTFRCRLLQSRKLPSAGSSGR